MMGTEGGMHWDDHSVLHATDESLNMTSKMSVD